MQHGVLASIAFFLAVFLAAQGSLAAGAGVKVTYDKQRDRLSIQAHKVSLTQVLGRIAAETGMNIRTHPDVEKTITLQLPPQPLERALKQLVRGLSYILEYDTVRVSGKTSRSRVVGMWLLPEGQQSSGQLMAVVNQGAGGGNPAPGDAPTPDNAVPAPVPPVTIEYFSPDSPDAIVQAEATRQTRPPSTQVRSSATHAQEQPMPKTSITGTPADAGITGDVP